MKALRYHWEGFMGFIVRVVISSFLFGLALALLASYIHWSISKTLVPPKLEGKMDRELKSYLKWLAVVALAIIAFQLLAPRASAQDLNLFAKRNVVIVSEIKVDTVIVSRVQGSGIIIRKDTVLTVAHVLGTTIKVDGKVAKVVALDMAHDLALLAVSTDSVPEIHLDLSPQPLQPVIAVGNPLGKHNFITLGYVAWADAEFVNTSNIAMPGYSGAGAYGVNNALVGVVVAGEGTCTFGYTIDRLVSARRVLIFLKERPMANTDSLFKEKAQAPKLKSVC